MIRKTDGSPVARLGEGVALAISPDKQWVLSAVQTTPLQYRQYPTGAGQTAPVDWKLEDVGWNNVAFFLDGRHLLVCGKAPGKAYGCYRSALDGSALELLIPYTLPYGGWLRPDGGAVAYERDGAWWIRSLADGRTHPVPGTGSGRSGPDVPNGYQVSRWSPDGSALWASETFQHFEQVNVVTGRRAPLVTLDLAGEAGTGRVVAVSLADDPHAYAIGTWGATSLIFSIRGMR